MYKVVKFFTDLHDNDHPYNAGDIFPRKGVSVSEQRIAELAGSNNKQGQPLIELVKEAPKSVETEEKPKKAKKAKAEE